jgi:hypothetical protein
MPFEQLSGGGRSFFYRPVKGRVDGDSPGTSTSRDCLNPVVIRGPAVKSTSVNSPSMGKLLLVLALLVFPALYILGGVWICLRKARGRQLIRRILVILLFLSLISLAPAESLTGYTVSLSFGPALMLLLSVSACLFAVILVWRENRAFGVAGIFVFPAVLVLAFGSLYSAIDESSISQLMSGRLSPTLSYRVVPTEGGFGAHYYVIEEYTNPSRFPIVQTRIASGILPCGGTEDEIRSHRVVPSISLGPNANTLHVVCVDRDGVIAPSSEDVRLLMRK